jgi:hypothetical protein
LCKQFRIGTVTGDKWGKEWVQAAWRGTGVAYVQSPLAKSDLYLECVPLFSRGLVRLPDHPKLLHELRLLQLQRHSGGKLSVDHPKNEHDDCANAVCGVLRGLSDHLGYDRSLRAFANDFVDEDAAPADPDKMPSAANQKLADFYRNLAGGFGPPSQPAAIQWPRPPQNHWPW